MLSEIFLEAEVWVAFAFIIFLGLLGYIGAYRSIAKALDDRTARIKAELDDARRLKDEAAQVLAEYQKKRGEAEREAEGIISGAKAEAERLAAEAKKRLEELGTRPTQKPG